MQRSTAVMRCWLGSDEAATAIEYSVLAAGIAMAIVVAATQIGTSLEQIFTDVQAGF